MVFGGRSPSIDLLRNEYLLVIFGGFGGIFASWLTHKVMNKRGIFRYYVAHNKIGISTQHSVFGTVEVRWNNDPINHLFISTIELKNDSLNDYENITINTYTNNTKLLSEFTHVLETPNTLNLTQAYKDTISVPNGEFPNEYQRNIYYGQREYYLPVFNRGQIVKIEYLNSSITDEQPSIWLSATVKGVKVVYQQPQELIFNTPKTQAAIYGCILGIVGLIPLINYLDKGWMIGLIALVYGYLVVVPGAYFIKACGKIKDLVAD